MRGHAGWLDGSQGPEGHGWGRLLLGLVAAVTLGLLWLARSADAAEPLVLEIGAVDCGGSEVLNCIFAEEDWSFQLVRDQFEAAADDPNRHTFKVPVSVTGPASFTLEDTVVTIDDDPKFQVTLRGTSRNFLGVTGDQPVEVLMVFDFLGAANDGPTVILSGRVGGASLGEVLNLADDDPLAETGLEDLTFTNGRLAEFVPELEHVRRPENLSAPAVEFFTTTYGGDLPVFVPALQTLGPTAFVTAGMNLDGFGPIPAAFFGWEDGDRALIEGSLGIPIDAAGSFDPAATPWRLRGTLPTRGLPDGFPEFLAFEGEQRWTAEIGYSHPLAYLQAEASMTTDLFGPEARATVIGHVTIIEGNPFHSSVSVNAVFDEDWPEPFDVDWLTIERVELDGQFQQTSDGPMINAHLRGFADVAGREFVASVGGRLTGQHIDASIELVLIGSVEVTELLDVVDIDVPELPSWVTTAELESPSIRVDVTLGTAPPPSTSSSTTTTDPPGVELRVGITLTGGIDFEPPGLDLRVGATAMFHLDTHGHLTVGVRADEDLLLSQVLPDVAIPPQADFALATDDGSSSFGFLFSTDSLIDQQVQSLPIPVRRFYLPLLGKVEDSAAPVTFSLPAGFSVLGSFELPTDLTQVVDTIGVESRVTARGTLPVLSGDPSIQLQLGLQLQSRELLPDFIDNVVGFITVRGSLHSQTIELGLAGEVWMRFRSGLPREEAEPLNQAGIPVLIDEAVAEDHPCPSGTPLPTFDGNDSELRCYDVLQLTTTASIEFTDTSITLSGNAVLNTPEGTWHPYGLLWWEIQRLVMEFEVAVGEGSVELTFGVFGDMKLGTKDVLAAVSLDVVPTPGPPFVRVELNGIRVASGAGVAITDLFDLHHQMATIVAQNAGGGEVPKFDIEEFDIPNFAIRNLGFSFSPRGVPSLCIPAGLVVQGDLYVNPTGDEPIRDPDCQNSVIVIPPEAQCVNNRLNGCIASGNLQLSTTGFVGQFQIPGFDLGPVAIHDLVVDVVLTLPDQHMTARGGASIGPGVLSGELAIDLKPFTATLFERVNVFGFGALVDATRSLDLLSDPEPFMDFHVLLAADDVRVPSPSFQSFLNQYLGEVLWPARALAVTAQEVLDLLRGGDPVAALLDLPDVLDDVGVAVPGYIADFADHADEFLDEFGDVLDEAPVSVFEGVLNGIPPFEFEGVEGTVVDAGPFGEYCIGIEVDGECWLVPPFDFGGVAGICGDVFPASQFPDLHDGDRCTRTEIIDDVVFPIFERSVEQALGVDDVDTAALIETLATAESDTLLGLECAEFNLHVGTHAVAGDVTIRGSVFGVDLGFRYGFDFAHPEANVPGLVHDIVDQLLDPTSVSCVGYNADVFGDDGDDPGAGPRVRITAPDFVREGDALTLNGTVSGLPDGSFGQVFVEWGDGTSTELVQVDEDGALTWQHAYPDDDPTKTAGDAKTIRATLIVFSGQGSLVATGADDEAITVRNATPSPMSFVSTGGSTAEGSLATFRATFADQGSLDTHRVAVDWGDGHVDSIDVPSGGRAVDVAHAYRDDDPTGTPSDQYDVTVTVVDDDTGKQSRAFPVTVSNVAPSDVSARMVRDDPDLPLVEGDLVRVVVEWDDPGGGDVHFVTVNWGDGTAPVTVQPGHARAERRAEVEYVWGDNGTFPVSVTVTDDDTGAASTSLLPQVVNQAPAAALARADTFASPAGPTFLTRVGVPLESTVSAIDPGSDDLTFGWAWGDGLADQFEDRVNPPADDPLPSPTFQPRAVVRTRSHAYSLPCLRTLRLDVVDDDGGATVDEVPVVAVGDWDSYHLAPFWELEFRFFGTTGLLRSLLTSVGDTTLACHLAVARHMSSVFGDVVPVDTAAQAVAVLDLLPLVDLRPAVVRARDQFDRELLQVWLNVASGATGTYDDGMLIPQFAAVVYAAEATRLDPNASAAAIDGARGALLRAEFDYSCRGEGIVSGIIELFRECPA